MGREIRLETPFGIRAQRPRESRRVLTDYHLPPAERRVHAHQRAIEAAQRGVAPGSVARQHALDVLLRELSAGQSPLQLDEQALDRLVLARGLAAERHVTLDRLERETRPAAR